MLVCPMANRLHFDGKIPEVITDILKKNIISALINDDLPAVMRLLQNFQSFWAVDINKFHGGEYE